MSVHVDLYRELYTRLSEAYRIPIPKETEAYIRSELHRVWLHLTIPEREHFFHPSTLDGQPCSTVNPDFRHGPRLCSGLSH